MNTSELQQALQAGRLDEALTRVYGQAQLQAQRARFVTAVQRFDELFGQRDQVRLFTVAGRSEISGNHTDHNHGRVLAASIDLDIIAVAAKTTENTVEIQSEGFDKDVVCLSKLEVDPARFYHSDALIAGVCRGMQDRGFAVGGYVAYTTSNVLKGSGLSSSAAFEDMVGNIMNHLYNEGRIDNAEIAKISQYAENVYFGKPCGLMDQVACAMGGFVSIDFADPKQPVIVPLAFDLTGAGYSLCIVNTGGNHADLNEDYASVPLEMKQVAAHFGKEVLRDVTLEQIISDIPALRKECGDRAILRAIHYENENERVDRQAHALQMGDLDAFFHGVKQSGLSSFCYLQNVYTVKNVQEQGLSLALALAENYLANRGGAWRVHGGGFAGTIQAFVKTQDVPGYRKLMDAVFGAGACIELHVRAVGAGYIW